MVDNVRQAILKGMNNVRQAYGGKPDPVQMNSLPKDFLNILKKSGMSLDELLAYIQRMKQEGGNDGDIRFRT